MIRQLQLSTTCWLQPIMVVIVLLVCVQAAADDEHSAPGRDPVPLFRAADTLQLTFSADWRRLVRDKKNQQPYPAVLHYLDASGQRKEIALTVERRGLTRQQACRFPPIKLRFERADVADTLFAGNRSIKMVTHCDTGRRWDQYYIQEMLAYSIYNLFTERSFRVRPVVVTYHDTQRDSTDAPQFAFLVEDDKLVARRNGLKTSAAVSISPDDLDAMESSRFALFQYLIGNVDWSALSGPEADECCHNAKLITAAAGAPVFALPYDFDSSGLVNAHYAAPNENLPITSVTQRLYRGFCVHNHTLEAARAEFIAQRSAIESLFNQESRLRGSTRKRALSYLDEFYEVLDDDSKFERKITNACRK
jgi:hypothetical protein